MTRLGSIWGAIGESFQAQSWGDHLFNRWINTIMIMVHVGFGTVLVVADPIRFSSPTYDSIIRLSFGHVWTWGAMILFAAFLMSIPFKWANILGLWIGMGWMATWTGMFMTSVVTSPSSDAALVVACGGFAMINTALLTARVVDFDSFGG